MQHPLDTLAQQTGSLEPSAADRTKWTQALSAYTDAFLSETVPGSAYRPPTESLKDALEVPFEEEGRGFEEALSIIAQHVNAPGINAASGRFMGYIPGGGLFLSAIGDYLAALGNRYAGVYYAAPGAVRLENTLLRWMAHEIGYPSTSAGYLASGGSLANLSALTVARDVHEIEGERVAKAVVYLTEHAHHCLDKALRLAGLRTCIVRRIPVDAQYRMQVEVLENTVKSDQQAGLVPWLVVGSAGTTNTGSVDPLDAIGEVAEKHGLWYHIDGAYGGLFVLCPEGQARLKGMHRADSVVMDPHKTLFLPYGTGALLVRDHRHIVDSHRGDADYMQDIDPALDTLSPADVSPELTKHFRGLRMWLPLKVLGLAPFRAALSEKIQLAQYVYERLNALPGFETGPPPDLSVVPFRYVPPIGDPDAFNQALAKHIQAEGRVFLSSTQLDGRFTLRFAILCFRTHKAHVDEALDALQEAVKQVLVHP